ncbi:MAG: hypothetical protein ACPG06_04920 [Alphaproteobacteria bacterium]
MVNLGSLLKDKTVAIFGGVADGLAKAVDRASVRDLLIFGRAGTPHVDVPFSDYKQVARNNAKILMLRGNAVAALRRYAYVGHAEHLLVSVGFSLLHPFLWWGLLRFGTRGQYKFEGIAAADGAPLHQRYWLVFKPSRRKFKLGARVYYSPKTSLEELISQLSPYDYCLLRWHEELPDFNPDSGDDLDILASDEDAERIIEMLDHRVGTRPIDLYSASGGARTNFLDMAYMPPLIANEILASSVPATLGCKAPAPKPQYLSLVYHHLFHKGVAAGIPSNHLDNTPNATRIAALQAAAQACDMSPLNTMEEMADLLADEGWLPPRDMLSKYAVHNEWVQRHFFADEKERLPVGLAVFVLRQIAADHDYIPTILSELRNVGFEIIHEAPLSAAEKNRATRLMRGGNWGIGIDTIDGGGPVHIVIAQDRSPIAPNKEIRKTHPLMDNARIMKKQDLRHSFNELYAQGGRTNIMHASDNTDEALDYIEVIYPTRLEEFTELAHSLQT